MDDLMPIASSIVQTDDITNLYAAFVEAFGELRNVATDGEADTGTYRYKYMTLGAIVRAVREPLSSHGLAIIQAPSVGRGPDGRTVDVATRLLHSSGQWMESVVSIGVAAGANAQAIGSAITYGRRYGLTSMLGIASGDDDDGAAAASVPPEFDADAMAEAWIAEPEVKESILAAMDGDKAAARALWESDAPPVKNGWVARTDAETVVGMAGHVAERTRRAERAKSEVAAQVEASEAEVAAAGVSE